MKKINEMTKEEARGIRFVLMDIDDTLTINGKLPAAAYSALWQLKEAGLVVIPVTGRPAGWCDLIAREWPVDGVVGENGAFAFWEERNKNDIPLLKQEFFPGSVRNTHPVLLKIKAEALKEIPGLRIAKDQFGRMFDVAFDFAEEEPILTLQSAEKVKVIAEKHGAVAKVSSIHVNVWMGRYDKLSMVQAFLKNRFEWNSETGLSEVIFCGDSPNDEPMFKHFPITAGVSNILRYNNLIQYYPAFLSSKECGYGFAEIAEIILEKRREAN
ncbi:MAG: HAD-IIB family hydrolase [Treponema sp.]|jgi:HAD superfamily hydrolase (TIGR01484 family)|nr:HAD-IIB family hydrolase [Treponema sp.]